MSNKRVRVINTKNNRVKFVSERLAKSDVLAKQGFIIQPEPKATPIKAPVDSGQLEISDSNESDFDVDILEGKNTKDSVEVIKTLDKGHLLALLEVETRKGVTKAIENRINTI